jgi:hypothetical protein
MSAEVLAWEAGAEQVIEVADAPQIMMGNSRLVK